MDDEEMESWPANVDESLQKLVSMFCDPFISKLVMCIAAVERRGPSHIVRFKYIVMKRIGLSSAIPRSNFNGKDGESDYTHDSYTYSRWILL